MMSPFALPAKKMDQQDSNTGGEKEVDADLDDDVEEVTSPGAMNEEEDAKAPKVEGWRSQGRGGDYFGTSSSNK